MTELAEMQRRLMPRLMQVEPRRRSGRQRTVKLRPITHPPQRDDEQRGSASMVRASATHHRVIRWK